MRIAFVIGHHKRAKGAFSEYFKRREYDFYKGFECELAEIGDVYKHNSLIFTYWGRQKAMAKITKDYDIVFELHFNFSEHYAEGVEAWYYHTNNKTKEISERFCEKYSELSKTKNRGAKELYNKNQRGFGFVYSQKTNAIIVEPIFGNSEKDCKAFTINNFIESIKYSTQ